MNNNNAIDINKIMVNYGGKYLSLKECAEMFNLDPNILAGEYINNGDIFSSIMNASHKKAVLEAVSKYIISSSADALGLFDIIRVNTQNLEEYKNDFFRALNNRNDDEIIAFNKFNLIAIIKLNEQNMPLIRNQDKDFVTDLIDKIIYSEDFIINMSKKDASNLYNIITHYTIPFELISKINNYYLLCDDMDKLITPKTNNNMSKIKK